MEKVILGTIKQYNLLEPGFSLVLAISGGADSMALLQLFSELQRSYQLTLVVAHVNHRKRSDAELDQELVQAAAYRHGLPFECFQLPPGDPGENFHDYGRKERYGFFVRTAQKYGADAIVTAHHGDDHLETVIHRLLYQQNPKGLAGIEAASRYQGFKLIRPLIQVAKKDIYDYCQRRGIPYREDRSNESDAYTRNRIRHHIIPSLVKESPAVLTQARAISDAISEDEAYFASLVDELMSQVSQSDGQLRFSRSLLASLPPSVGRRFVWRLLQWFSYRDFQNSHVLKILESARNPKPNLRVDLPHDVKVVLAYEQVVFSKGIEEGSPFCHPLEMNGIVRLAQGASLLAKHSQVSEKRLKNCINEVHLCYNEIDFPLEVRTRLPGDRIALAGGGTKKLKEIMIEAKVPRQQRDCWPIVADGSGRVLWVPLLKKSKYCKTSLTEDMFTIEYRNDGGIQNA